MRSGGVADTLSKTFVTGCPRPAGDAVSGQLRDAPAGGFACVQGPEPFCSIG
jgi:hypothetical protein